MTGMLNSFPEKNDRTAENPSRMRPHSPRHTCTCSLLWRRLKLRTAVFVRVTRRSLRPFYVKLRRCLVNGVYTLRILEISREEFRDMCRSYRMFLSGRAYRRSWSSRPPQPETLSKRIKSNGLLPTAISRHVVRFLEECDSQFSDIRSARVCFRPFILNTNNLTFTCNIYTITRIEVSGENC